MTASEITIETNQHFSDTDAIKTGLLLSIALYCDISHCILSIPCTSVFHFIVIKIHKLS